MEFQYTQTAAQRFANNGIHVRFLYGHPDGDWVSKQDDQCGAEEITIRNNQPDHAPKKLRIHKGRSGIDKPFRPDDVVSRLRRHSASPDDGFYDPRKASHPDKTPTDTSSPIRPEPTRHRHTDNNHAG